MTAELFLRPDKRPETEIDCVISRAMRW